MSRALSFLAGICVAEAVTIAGYGPSRIGDAGRALALLIISAVLLPMSRKFHDRSQS